MEYRMKKSATTYVLAACGLAVALPQAAYALNAGACSKTHAQTVKNCPQDKILRAVQISEIVDGKSMTEAFYKISLA